VFHFHVSFYSRESDCWDAVGWWFMAIACFILRFVIPIFSVALCLVVHFELKDGSNAYSLLFMSYGFTCLFSTISFLPYLKKQFMDTWTWYRHRRATKGKVMS